MPEKIFATQNRMAIISCPYCGKSKQKDVSKFMEHKTQVRLKFKCVCKENISVILERRRTMRKDVQFNGFLIQNSIKHPILISNISQNGVKIRFSEPLSLNEGQTASIQFTLDDVKKSSISREVLIKKIFSQKSVGCKFQSTDHLDQLGKYFLFNF
jgi:hypothetical protein